MITVMSAWPPALWALVEWYITLLTTRRTLIIQSVYAGQYEFVLVIMGQAGSPNSSPASHTSCTHPTRSLCESDPTMGRTLLS